MLPLNRPAGSHLISVALTFYSNSMVCLDCVISEKHTLNLDFRLSRTHSPSYWLSLFAQSSVAEETGP